MVFRVFIIITNRNRGPHKVAMRVIWGPRRASGCRPPVYRMERFGLFFHPRRLGLWFVGPVPDSFAIAALLTAEKGEGPLKWIDRRKCRRRATGGITSTSLALYTRRGHIGVRPNSKQAPHAGARTCRLHGSARNTSPLSIRTNTRIIYIATRTRRSFGTHNGFKTGRGTWRTNRKRSSTIVVPSLLSAFSNIAASRRPLSSCTTRPPFQDTCNDRIVVRLFWGL